jgi:hypothetical protein
LLVFSLLENRSPLTLLHRKILPRSESTSKSAVFGFRTNLIIKWNVKPSINAEMFFDYVQIVFRLNLPELQRLGEFAEEIAVLLMDVRRSRITSVVMSSLLSPKPECAS